MTNLQTAQNWKSDPNVRYAFIVFRSMTGSDLVRQAYSINNWWRRLVMKYGDKKCPTKKSELERLHFF